MHRPSSDVPARIEAALATRRGKVVEVSQVVQAKCLGLDGRSDFHTYVLQTMSTKWGKNTLEGIHSPN